MTFKVASRRLEQLNNTLTKVSELPANRSELNPLSFLKRSSVIFPEHPAVITEDGKTISYKQFENNVLRLAFNLKERYGIKKGDRVGMICRNIPILLEANFSVPALRAILVAINTRLNAEEIAYIVQHSECKVVIYEAEFLALIKDINTEQVCCISSEVKELVVNPDEPINWNTFSEVGSEDDVITICYTSGTTGRPKGVMCTYRGVALACLNNVMEMGLTRQSRYLWTLPLFHCNGWCFPWSIVAVAGTSVLLSRVEPEQIWKHFKETGITHYCATPTVQIALLNYKNATSLPRCITAMIAGSPPSPALIEGLESLNINPIHTYGLTETYGPITINYIEHSGTKEEKLRRMSRQGHSYLLSDPARVVDSDMRDVPADGEAVGEVVLRGNMVMKGYYADPSSTAKAFSGGWFHTGDLAKMDPDGCIKLVDRAKDIVISGGENISTIEIEKVLAHHPLIMEVAVVSSPHSKWGETPKAFIVLKQPINDKEKLHQELFAFTRDRLAHFKCPTKLEFVTELPKTGTGKVQKFVLKQREWAKRNQTIG